MVPAPEPLGAPAPTSFTARRPHASNLPSFELPPPPLANVHTKYSHPGFPHLGTGQLSTSASSLTSVGNLLTPPSNASSDSLSPASGIASSAHGGPASYTPSSGGMWPPPSNSVSNNSNGTSSYAFQSSVPAAPFGSQARSLFSPSLNSVVRGAHSPTAGDSMPPPPFEMPQYAAASMSMSASSLPALQSNQQSQQQQQHHMVSRAIMGGAPASSMAGQSPTIHQDPYARQPPTPTYFAGSQQTQPSQNGGQHMSYSYPTATSPSQHSPLTASGSMKMSPVNGGPNTIPPLQPQYARNYTYSMPGPVLSNVNNPNGQMQVVGGIPHGGMMPTFNSGHAAHMQMYGQHPHMLNLNPQADRPFRCDQCPQSFNRNHDLKRHKRIHLAVKPFPCGHCDKSFSRKDALKRHVLVKGCGKANANSEVKEIDGSSSPSSPSESVHESPVITSV